jgi:hypothetical protein
MQAQMLAYLMRPSPNDENKGNTMKRYLHYCTYEIWDGFREFIDYKFYIFVNKSDIEINVEELPSGIEIKLEELPKTDKLNELIAMEIAKHKAELKERRRDKYFGEMRKNNIKIGDNSAVVISYEFNEMRKKGEEKFNFFLERVENCYIKLKDKTIVIRGSTLAKSSKEAQPFFEEFYKSYRHDQSQAFKTNYGSFKWVNGLRDKSTIKYLAYDPSMQIAAYIIKISYYYDESKDIVNQNLSFQEMTVELPGGKADVKKAKSDTIKTNRYNIQYDEIRAVLGSGERGKWAEIRIFDFNPGIYIEVSEQKPNSFDKYRKELNAMIKSIQFYPELEK